MLDHITPVVLTYNEAPNIARLLEKLEWARDVVVVDSYSSDETLSIVKGFPNCRVVQREFDVHCNQLNFALAEGGITSPWVLALSADFIPTDDLITEMAALVPADTVGAYRIGFSFHIFGKPLRASVYPAQVVLFRHQGARYVADGHTEHVSVDGAVLALKGHIIHDDRKPVSRWLAAQDGYMRLETEKLLGPDPVPLELADRIRKLKVLAPFLVLLYCLFAKRLILDGLPGIFYAFQRAASEMILSVYLMDHALRERRERRNDT